MWKKLGLAGIVLVMVVLLRPEFFKKSLGFGTESSEESKQARDSEAIPTAYRADKKSEQPRATQTNLRAEGEEEQTMYAEGYNAEDFKGMEPPEEMFASDPADMVVQGIWKDLATLEFQVEYDPALDEVVYRPKFTDLHRSYEGKTIEVPGFIVPIENVQAAMDIDGDMFILSGLPIASCFFCGGAGPETVMEVYPAEPIPFNDEKVTLKGRLELNGSDFLRLPYVLRDVRLVQE